RPEENPGPSFILLIVVETTGAHDDISESVPVHVARRRRLAELSACLIALEGPGRREGQPRGRAEVEEGLAFVHLRVVQPRRADRGVIEPSTVDVSRGGDP